MTKKFNRIKKMLSGSTTMPMGAGGSPSDFPMGMTASENHPHGQHDADRPVLICIFVFCVFLGGQFSCSLGVALNGFFYAMAH